MKKIFLVVLCFVLTGCLKNDPGLAVRVINMGVSGNTVSNLIDRTYGVFIAKPNLVIIMIGTNDSKTSGSDFQDYKANLTKLITSIKNKGIAVMLATPPPIAKTSTAYSWSGRLDSLCTDIKQISTEKKCYLVDINSEFSAAILKAGGADMYLVDGLHPDSTGYSTIGGYISSFLKENSIKASKIVCFGDSITYGAWVSGAGTVNGDTYPAVLQRDLNSN